MSLFSFFFVVGVVGQSTIGYFVFLEMKVSTAAVVLAVATGGASAYQQPTRSTLRSLGQKSVSVNAPSRTVGSSMKMEGESLPPLNLH